MPTLEEIKKFEELIEKDVAQTRELLDSEKMLMKAVERYEKAWGVKIKKPLVIE